MDKISVIIPIYNSEKYIETCVKSLKKQTYDNLEILLIDDGSKETCVELCRKICEEDDRFKLFSQKNQGVSVARNSGLKHATGKYVCFLDSDDAIHPLLIEEMIKHLEKTKAEMAVCGYAILDENGYIAETENASVMDERPDWVFLDRKKTEEAFHSTKTNLYHAIGGKMIRRDVIDEIRFKQDVSLGEDTLFIYDVVSAGISSIYTESNWYFYQKHENNASKNAKNLLNPEHLDCFRYVREKELERGNEKNAIMWHMFLFRSLGSKIIPLKKIEDKEERKKIKDSVKRFKLIVRQEKKNPLYKKIPTLTKCTTFCFLYFYNNFHKIYFVTSKIQRCLEKVRVKIMKKFSKKRNKIGIITFHCSDNFGAMLQTYGSKTWLRNHNYEASVVRYEPPFLTGRHWRIPYKPDKSLRQILRVALYSYRKNREMGKDFKVQRKKMSGFRKNHLNENCMPRYFSWQLWNLPFSTYIVGSDQIWNPDITFGLRPVYFGAFKTRKKKKVISYGASFGGSSVEEKYTEEFKTLLSNVDAISMREAETVSFINSMGREAIGVCDPVFLLDAFEWEKVTNRPDKRDYILVFATERNEEMYRCAKELAAEKNLEVVELKMRKYINNDGFTEVYTAGPSEFLGYILNAKYVITNSFHATAFSIILRRRFFAYFHSNRGLRISNLLNLTGLMDRAYTGQAVSEIEKSIEWTEVHKKICDFRSEAENFLKNNL